MDDKDQKRLWQLTGDEWPPELNISSFVQPPRPSWRLENVEALQKVLAASRLFQSGLTPAAALNLARAVHATMNVAAVAVSNGHTSLAFVGPSQDGEPPHQDRLCPAIRLAMETGKYQTCRHESSFTSLSNCWREVPEENDNPVPNWLVAVPLENTVEVVGALVVYGSESYPLQSTDLELARVLAAEANQNLELGRLRGSAGQLAEAELRALRAQISPHFLFNTLNSIAALVRLDAEQARELIVDFASFFRRTLKQHGEFVTLAEELDYVSHYLRFEQVRFGNNLKVKLDVGAGTENVVVPVLTVQPLVENAVHHGLGPKIGGGTVSITTKTVDYGDVLIEVADDGIGMNVERGRTPHQQEPGLGMALSNINQRLQKLFGQEYNLLIESSPGTGTKVSFRVPRIRRTEP